MEGIEVGVLASDKELFNKYSRVLPPRGGVCIDDIGKEQVPETMICRYFGPKSSKSGWKHDGRQTPEQAAAIYDLWQRVYDERLMPNREISLQFARGLILQSQDVNVDWVEFAVTREKYRSRKSRASSKVSVTKKVEGGDDRGGVGSRVSIFGKRRCIASTPPPIVKLTVKEEFPVEVAMEKKECVTGRGKVKGLVTAVCSPSWEPSDICEMVAGIDGCKKLTSTFRAELLEHSREKENLEVEVRRARMMLSDRFIMLEEAEAEVKKLVDEVTMALFPFDEGHCEQLALKRKLADRSLALSCAQVTECESTIARLDGQLKVSSERYTLVSARLSSLVELLGGMAGLLLKMQVGGGSVLYPRPLFSNPESPISTVHVLNACPVCGYWYSCCNFVSLACGHTYHHFCLSEQAKKSRTCIFELCREPFLDESIAAIGIRPIAPQGSDVVDVKKEGSLAAEAVYPTNPCPAGVSAQDSEPAWGTEKSTKGIQNLSQSSQSSQTTVFNTRGAVTAVEEQIVRAICVMCKIRDAAVILKNCGHDVFCFNCIQGLCVCPVCEGPVVGWDAIKSNSLVSPMLLSLGDAGDVAMDPLLPKNPPKKKCSPPNAQVVRRGPTLWEAVELDKEDDEQDVGGFNGGNDNGDATGFDAVDEHDGGGLVYFCDDEAFRNGASRSVSPEQMLDDCEMQADQHVPVAKESTPKLKRPRTSKTLKSLDEICSSNIPTVGYVEASESCAVATVLTKRKPGRPSAASKVVARIAELDSNAPGSPRLAVGVQQARCSQLRSTSGRNTIPSKFRGL